ncbi:MAG: hypothetical protein HY868_10685 [Chloroflexi bacterium]|nr:hypothetical protein [Chloroflexota bacterium]
MPSNFLLNEMPASRHAIENALRFEFWRAGFKTMWFSCVKDAAPFQAQAAWGEKNFAIEWEPKKYLLLKLSKPDQAALNAFELVLKHKPLAAYKDGDGKVVVEWRVKDGDARFQELQSAGVAELQRIK